MATATKSRTITDEQIDQAIDDLDAAEIEKLKRFTKMNIARTGVVGVREGSNTWEKARREVIAELLKNDMRVRDVEESSE